MKRRAVRDPSRMQVRAEGRPLMTDLEITSILASAVTGIAAFFRLGAYFRNARGRRIECLSGAHWESIP